MSRSRPLLPALTLAMLAASLALPLPASADGIIIPDPPPCPSGACPPRPLVQLAIEYHRVEVTIEDQVAVTRVDQVFRNDNDWDVEGSYIFPLPPGATVTEFVLWVDGEPVQGRVLEREQARQIYLDIVRTLRDPALLEYLDRGAVQASIFPIPAGSRSRVELEYTQVLEAENGLVHYRYPLSTERFSTEPLEQVSVTVTARSRTPLRAVYSPSHALAIERQGEHAFRAGYEDAGVRPDTDFELYFSLAEQDLSLSLLTYRDPSSDEPDGFFLLLAAPSLEADPERRVAKDVILVLDQSGSMDGEKFRQAQQALLYVLDHLHPEDRFNIVAFSTGLRSYASGLRPASQAGLARAWVQGLSAAGATDIQRALLEAIVQVDPGRPAIVIFLTDGLPTEGETDTARILEQVRRAAPASLRLFPFGVGYDVDTLLLDSLARSHHGSAAYVTPGQAIDEVVSAFYARVSSPVLTDLALDLGRAGAYDLYPEPLPDLFAGGQLVLVGRYRQPGTHALTLTGAMEGRRATFEFPSTTFAASGGPDFLPRLWATRKIGALLQQIRLEGPQPEIVEQVVRLSIRYGIVTPYTSYLVTEPGALGAEGIRDLAAEEYQRMLAMPTQVSGQAAVERSAAESGFSGADVAPAPSAEAAHVVRVAGTRAFRWTDGVWVDTTYDGQTMAARRLPFLSDDYFALAQASPDLAAALALGPRVIVLAGGQAYEVIDPDAPGDPFVLPVSPVEPDAPRPGASSGGTARPPSGAGSGAARGLPCPGGLLLGLALAPLAGRARCRRH